MAEVFRYAIGIDCSKDAVHACFSGLDEEMNAQVKLLRNSEMTPQELMQ